MISLLENQHLFADGGMGTQLQSLGLTPGTPPDLWNLEHPQSVQSVHTAYLEAGARLITSNTFGSNAMRYRDGKYTVSELAASGIKLVRQAIEAFGEPAYAALDIGPLGVFMDPIGDLTFSEAVDLFAVPIEAGAEEADCILIETMCDAAEASAAITAAKKYAPKLPVLCTMSFDGRGRLMTGMDIASAGKILSDSGADVIGSNCGMGPDQVLSLLPQFLSATKLPILLSPNAGLPVFQDGRTVYLVTPEDFAKDMKQLYDGGAWGVGGCCGTTPEHIRAMIQACKD